MSNSEIFVTLVSTPHQPVGTLHIYMGAESHAELTVAFHGVRGSTPCSCPTLQRYGGNTSCVTLEFDGTDPIVLDLGTGLRPWGTGFHGSTPARVHALVTHLHWDHVQGLPFFVPLQNEDSTLDVYGPGEHGQTLAESFDRFMAPPFFPIQACELPGTVRFHDTLDSEFEIDDASVMARAVPHIGPTVGYRIEMAGVTVAYVPDHQEPIGRPEFVDEAVLELCDGVDVLIHDAQYRPDELLQKADWGHCTPQYALEVARQAGVKQLVLFHHDPFHDDVELDRIAAEISERAESVGVGNVIAATEGLKLSLAGDL